jgi:spoIIIJ-associated protein
MHTTDIQNLTKELIEKIQVKIKDVSVVTDDRKSTWLSIEVEEPRFFIDREGEGLHALTHLVHRIIEARSPRAQEGEEKSPIGILIDINGYQKKHVESIRAVAHMMSERARYFKANVEVDPMSAFERRIVHEFLSEAEDLQTESIGTGRDRRVVIKYIGGL